MTPPRKPPAPTTSVGTLRLRLYGGSAQEGVALAQDVAARLAAEPSSRWSQRGVTRVSLEAPRRGSPSADVIAGAISAALKRNGGGDA